MWEGKGWEDKSAHWPSISSIICSHMCFNTLGAWSSLSLIFPSMSFIEGGSTVVTASWAQMAAKRPSRRQHASTGSDVILQWPGWEIGSSDAAVGGWEEEEGCCCLLTAGRAPIYPGQFEERMFSLQHGKCRRKGAGYYCDHCSLMVLSHVEITNFFSSIIRC